MQQDLYPERQVCAWCGLRAVGYKLVKHAVLRKKDGKATVIQSADYSPACGMHLGIVVVDPIAEKMRKLRMAKHWKSQQMRID